MIESAYQRLEHGEPNVPLRYLRPDNYYQALSELRSEITIGQFCWDLEHGTTELLLTRLPKYVEPRPTRSYRVQFEQLAELHGVPIR